MSTPTETRRHVSEGVVLLGFGAAVAVVAVVGGLAASGSRSTYADLDLPPFAPPGWLFGPVWTVLYVLIALSGWLIWRRVGWHRSLVPYAVQLVLNAAWTPLFFGTGWYGLALAEILVLLGAIVWTVAEFAPISSLAAWLLAPYALWVVFATCLNASIWWLNR